MRIWVLTDPTEHVTATTIGGTLDDGTEVDLPEGYDLERQQDWRLADGALVYDPEESG